jgi:hypothetical protein
MNRYVVMVRGVDDSFDAYGVFHVIDRATEFADAFNVAMEAIETERPDEPDGIAWAYVMDLRAPNLRASLNVAGLA